MNIVRLFRKERALNLFGLLYFSLSERNGRAYCVQKGCTHIGDNFTHMRGIYIHIGKLDGDIMWRSRKCYERANP